MVANRMRFLPACIAHGSIPTVTSKKPRRESRPRRRRGIAFMRVPKKPVKHGYGLLLDIHGHRHIDQRVELGYLIKGEPLKATDTELNADAALIASTSIRDLDKRSPQSFAELVRGPQSLGGLLEFRGFRCLPSPTKSFPGVLAGYFSGAYDITAHGSRDGGTVSAIQIECPWNGLRDKPENQRRFAKALVESLDVYFEVHFGRKPN